MCVVSVKRERENRRSKRTKKCASLRRCSLSSSLFFVRGTHTWLTPACLQVSLRCPSACGGFLPSVCVLRCASCLTENERESERGKLLFLLSKFSSFLVSISEEVRLLFVREKSQSGVKRETITRVSRFTRLLLYSSTPLERWHRMVTPFHGWEKKSSEKT